MSDSRFSGRLFIAGSLVGLRAFKVDRLGRLAGPSHGGIFKPGENVAQCGYGYKHQVASKDCACGYYAYFNGKNTYNEGINSGNVTALIEGYGTVTLGSEGFRAEKAKLVALVEPRFSALDGTPGWFPLVVIAFTAAMWTMFGLTVEEDVNAPSLIGFIFGLLGAVAIPVSIFFWLDDMPTPLAKEARAERVNQWALIKRNYPDVPVFRSTRAARSAFPTTPPPPEPVEIPGPDSPDFWTRSFA